MYTIPNFPFLQLYPSIPFRHKWEDRPFWFPRGSQAPQPPTHMRNAALGTAQLGARSARCSDITVKHLSPALGASTRVFRTARLPGNEILLWNDRPRCFRFHTSFANSSAARCNLVTSLAHCQIWRYLCHRLLCVMSASSIACRKIKMNLNGFTRWKPSQQ